MQLVPLIPGGQVFSCRGRGEFAVLYALCCDEFVGDSADGAGAAAHDQNFHAVVVVEMDVDGGGNLVVMATPDEALENIRKLSPDLAIVDISLDGGNGIDLVKAIKSEHEDLPVLIISMHDESLYAERALKAGAMG